MADRAWDSWADFQQEELLYGLDAEGAQRTLDFLESEGQIVWLDEATGYVWLDDVRGYTTW